ncbi:uncharacterized protein BP01DRAFT_356400 [Aspergillus saccharolyticus JOP 1030-1]|uniref:DUF1996 domain-containing protein n=1 Tax=Aspergillus saccharolyticus JOP 1030-1 TaxID=1450539 RepID=A0A318ZHC3_9EURO|nr:hypothetical protein BP01DRAFT_356400 [Aspergillus saccharolyticus JOP 1030-1]PYH45764.1 hypothetical protein BP01DRAFT_356400 [Aspergillus saccharolyticus JOP 1030-1]
MSANEASLRQSSCTSCAVTQDKSAYWAPALYFVHQNGDAELVNEVGGMLAYYLLNGDNVTAFPDNFRMMAGDTYLRDFPWPVPDPPQAEWTGDDLSQEALRQKAVGFNCLNYEKDPEPSLARHFLPNKTYLDEHCTQGVRFELMFPSCWNGKDVDTPDHKSHLAYPSLVMDGKCPKGFEHRLVSLFYENIWDTYAFKSKKGDFVLANGDPTGYGYHGDFMYGWESNVLQQAVNTCTNMSGEVSDCPIFNLQSDEKQGECRFSVPDALKNEDVNYHKGGLPNNLVIQSGPAYASPVRYSTTTTTTTAAGGHGRPTPVIIDDLPNVGVGIDLGFLSAGLHVALPGLTTSSPTTAKAWEPTAPPVVVEAPPAHPTTAPATHAHTAVEAPLVSATSTTSAAQVSIPSTFSTSGISTVSIRPSSLASSSVTPVLSTMAVKSSTLLAYSQALSSSGVFAKPSAVVPPLSTDLATTIAKPSIIMSSAVLGVSSSIADPSPPSSSAITQSSALFAASSPVVASSSDASKSSVLNPSEPKSSLAMVAMSSTPLLSSMLNPPSTVSSSQAMLASSSIAALATSTTSKPLIPTPSPTTSASQTVMSAALLASSAAPESTKSIVASSTQAPPSTTSILSVNTALPVSSTFAVAAKPPVLATPSSTSVPLIKTAAQTSSASEMVYEQTTLTSTSSTPVMASPSASSTFAIAAKPAVTTSTATSAPLIKSAISSSTSPSVAKSNAVTRTTSTALIKTTTSVSSTLAMTPRPLTAAYQAAESSTSALLASDDWEQITTWSPPSSTSSADTVSSTSVVYVEQEIIVLVDDQGVPIETQTGSLATPSKPTSSVMSGMSSGVTASERPRWKRDGIHRHAYKHLRHGHSH